MSPEPSSCSCPLPAHLFGFAGWHHRVADLKYWCNRIWNLEYTEHHDRYLKPGGSVDEEIREEIRKRAERMPAFVAVEMCPHYRAAIVANIQRDKATRSTRTGSPEESW